MTSSTTLTIRCPSWRVIDDDAMAAAAKCDGGMNTGVCDAHGEVTGAGERSCCDLGRVRGMLHQGNLLEGHESHERAEQTELERWKQAVAQRR